MNLVRKQGSYPMDLWEAFDGLRDELYDAIDLFRVPEVSGLFDHSAAPPMDIIEGKDAYLVLADLPGISKEDVELSVTGTLLTIKGEVKADKGSEKRKFYRREGWQGSFQRSLNLPAMGDQAGIKAELKDGVLSVRVPKREEQKTKLIEVTVK
jgi:HSP20 family protein